MFHCSEIKPKRKWSSEEGKRGWLALVGIDKPDSQTTVNKALGELVKTLKYSNEKTIIFLPFRQLVKEPGEPGLLDCIIKELKHGGYDASFLDLHDATGLLINVFGHRVSVAFREIS